MKLPKHLAAALMAAALLPNQAKAAVAWRVVESVVDRRPEMAAICQFWNATVFAPGESESCPIGTLFFVDLNLKSLHYADRGPRGLGQSERDRKQVVEVMYRNLSNSGALEKLEAYRTSQEIEKNRQLPKRKLRKNVSTTYRISRRQKATLNSFKTSSENTRDAIHWASFRNSRPRKRDSNIGNTPAHSQKQRAVSC
jgi:hypothetical protein